MRLKPSIVAKSVDENHAIGLHHQPTNSHHTIPCLYKVRVQVPLLRAIMLSSYLYPRYCRIRAFCVAVRSARACWAANFDLSACSIKHVISFCRSISGTTIVYFLCVVMGTCFRVDCCISASYCRTNLGHSRYAFKNLGRMCSVLHLKAVKEVPSITRGSVVSRIATGPTVALWANNTSLFFAIPFLNLFARASVTYLAFAKSIRPSTTQFALM